MNVVLVGIWSVSLLGDARATAAAPAAAAAVQAVVLTLMPHYLRAFREGRMRSYATWLQRGHTTRGSCSLCLALPHTFHSAFAQAAL